jgi:glycopeptide antibiotics resistance protein
MALPWLFPGVGAALVLSPLLSGPAGRALGVRRVVAWVLLLSLGVILAATLTPLRGAFDGVRGSGTCDFSRMGVASIEDLRTSSDAGLNVLIFIPFGLAIGIVPRSRRKTAIVAAAIALPFAIEMIQLLLPALDRACESADVADNLTGLVIGLAIGTLVGRFLPSVRRPPEPSSSRGGRLNETGNRPASR